MTMTRARIGAVISGIVTGALCAVVLIALVGLKGSSRAQTLPCGRIARVGEPYSEIPHEATVVGDSPFIVQMRDTHVRLFKLCPSRTARATISARVLSGNGIVDVLVPASTTSGMLKVSITRSVPTFETALLLIARADRTIAIKAQGGEAIVSMRVFAPKGTLSAVR
jgi:hypothetical protein